MDIDAIWEEVLDVLRTRLPRISFQTWVEGACPIEVREGKLVVCPRNSYAMAWLEDHATGICNQVLSQYGLSVVFRGGSDLETARQEDARDEANLLIVPGQDTNYQEIVRPDRVIVFPGYMLRMMTSGDLTPKDMSLWLGFYQAAYFANGRNGQPVSVPYWKVLKFAMMSKATLFREIGSTDRFAGGLIEKVEQGRMGDSNMYLIHTSPHLTKTDLAVFATLIRRVVADCSSKDAAIVKIGDFLREITKKPASFLDEVKPDDALTEQVSSLEEVIRITVGVEDTLPTDIVQAIESLTDHILSSYGHVVVTHYFFEEVVKKLGFTPAQAWAIILLRDKVWYDYSAGVSYPFAFLDGGLDRFASCLGVTRRTVELWLTQPAFSAFVQRIPTENVTGLPPSFSDKGCFFWVRLTEPLPGELNLLMQGQYPEIVSTLHVPASFFSHVPQWDYWGLCEKSQIDRQTAAEILRFFRSEREAARALVSWILYVHSDAGAGIRTPVVFIVSRLRTGISAGGDFDTLASIPPNRFSELLQFSTDHPSVGGSASFSELLQFSTDHPSVGGSASDSAEFRILQKHFWNEQSRNALLRLLF